MQSRFSYLYEMVGSQSRLREPDPHPLFYREYEVRNSLIKLKVKTCNGQSDWREIKGVKNYQNCFECILKDYAKKFEGPDRIFHSASLNISLHC